MVVINPVMYSTEVKRSGKDWLKCVIPLLHLPTPLIFFIIHMSVNICSPELSTLHSLCCSVSVLSTPGNSAIVMEKETDFIPDLPKGPLNIYRKQASFDWKKLKLVFDKPAILKLKVSTF